MALASAAQEAVWLLHLISDLNETSVEQSSTRIINQASVWRKIRSTMDTLNMWILNFISSGNKWQQEQYNYNNVSDVVNPALADASSSAWEFSPTFNSSALLANPR